MTDGEHMNSLPEDHPARRLAADEVHARPQEALETPQRATFVAVIIDNSDRGRELDHIAALCSRFGVAPPGPDDIHFTARLGAFRMKWERHSEFSGYTFIVAGQGRTAFGEPASSLLPEGWLAAIPGSTIVAAHAMLVRAAAGATDPMVIAEYFGGNVPVGALVGDGAGSAFTDFRIHADGHVRYVVEDRGFTPRQAGRMLQRLFEIEAYRVLALLALPVARQLAPRSVAIERSLVALTEAIAHDTGGDEALLSELTKLAAEVESARNASQMRFSASRAYHELVRTRIAELRERRIPGIQTIEEFMTRRLAPAMATCTSVAQRLHDLSMRVANACGLLSTRVEIARERQNHALLTSMEQRAGLQLRLQQTVEWLSVAAVTYYAASLVGYLCKALKAAGVAINPDVAVGISIPLIGAVTVMALHFARRRLGTRTGARPK